ncbi:MAG: GNAT family N-acetyltransferase, partial [Candidatus Heimdallarchaeota archaeon]|nr:GNAT family N-acetyltransferase [Candidatus Heimdallarchaeota archaeon]
MIRLETDRLIIRNFTLDDWEDLAELAMKYEQSELAKYDEGPWPNNLEEYKSIVKNFSEGDDFVAVILKEEKKLIGLIFKAKKEEKRFEFGFNFHSDFHGMGYATESCQAVLDYIFKVLEAEIVTAGTAKINNPSNNLLKRLDFSFVGEKNISFRKDEEGKPIEFVGVDY